MAQLFFLVAYQFFSRKAKNICQMTIFFCKNEDISSHDKNFAEKVKLKKSHERAQVIIFKIFQILGHMMY